MKKNDPFSMAGSYIGLLIGIIIGFFTYSTISVLCEFGACKITAYILPLLPIITGFLIGWFIHHLIRK